MLKVKIITHDNHKDLENDINEFISTKNADRLIDIKYNTTATSLPDGRGVTDPPPSSIFCDDLLQRTWQFSLIDILRHLNRCFFFCCKTDSMPSWGRCFDE